MRCHQPLKRLNLFSIFILVLMISTQTLIQVSAQDEEVARLVEPSYTEIIDQWNAEYSMGPSDYNESFLLADQDESSTAELVSAEETNGYQNSIVHMKDGSQSIIELEVPETGLYQLAFDYYRLNDGFHNKDIPH